VLAGRGAVWSGARAALVELAERSGALLATTLLAKDFFAGADFNLGVVGTFGSAFSTDLLAETDCVLAFGANLHTWTTRVGTLFPKARLIQIDRSERDVGDFTLVERTILADATETATALTAMLPVESAADPSWRGPERRAHIAAWRPEQEITDDAGDGRVDPRRLLVELDRLLPRERMVFSDGGHFWSYPGAYLSVPEPDSFALAANFGSIGLGLATAIGGGIGRPDRLPVLIVGDGGLHMSIAELDTAVRVGRPMVIVVLNDAAYGSEVHVMRAAGLDPSSAQFPETDFAALAVGFGAAGLTVADLSDLGELPARLAELRGPLVIDAKIDRELVAPWYRVAKLAAPPRP
jgi:thiamine pyrophosphate-dependent acetolactate synthase large subunit-like protein